MSEESREGTAIGRVSVGFFVQIEHAVSLALGALLALAALLALVSSAAAVWSAVGDWHGTEGVVRAVDRLLFVLMVIEIMHTVRMALSSGVLTVEPFLVVGVIASIRRVLVITLQTANAGQGGGAAQGGGVGFQSSMIELAVLGGLILVMVVAIFLLHRSGQVASTEPKLD